MIPSVQESFPTLPSWRLPYFAEGLRMKREGKTPKMKVENEQRHRIIK